jgi:26S proteasome regulatory subunit N3
MNTCIDKISAYEATLPLEEEIVAESKSKDHGDKATDENAMETVEESEPDTAPTSVMPEVEVFLFNLCVTTLLRYGLNVEAGWASSVLVAYIDTFNRRSLDLMSSKAYFYFSLAHEKLDKLADVRPTLLKLYRTSCVRRDEMGQAVLLNLLLRNYLHYNLIDGAKLLSARTVFPENVSNNQFCRYLYYMGRVQAVQMEYTDAYKRLMWAARKAPQDVGIEFQIVVQKLTVIVQLLMGEIPERSLFNQPEYRMALAPYFDLTKAVRSGDMQAFSGVVSNFSDTFKKDQTLTLIQRLAHNVVKAGLRRISISYSRIKLGDVSAKLLLPAGPTTEYICAKAIRDGVIDATIDHDEGVLMSNEAIDLYATEEPQRAFHARIGFCLDVHNDAIKAMRYPPDAYKRESKKLGDEETSEKTIEELIKEMEEDDE